MTADRFTTKTIVTLVSLKCLTISSGNNSNPGDPKPSLPYCTRSGAASGKIHDPEK